MQTNLRQPFDSACCVYLDVGTNVLYMQTIWVYCVYICACIRARVLVLVCSFISTLLVEPY